MNKHEFCPDEDNRCQHGEDENCPKLAESACSLAIEPALSIKAHGNDASPAPAAASNLVISKVGGKCPACGFEYFAHQGHLIRCPRCEVERLERALAQAHSVISEQTRIANEEMDGHKAEIDRLRAERERLANALRGILGLVRLIAGRTEDHTQNHRYVEAVAALVRKEEG